MVEPILLPSMCGDSRVDKAASDMRLTRAWLRDMYSGIDEQTRDAAAVAFFSWLDRNPEANEPLGLSDDQMVAIEAMFRVKLQEIGDRLVTLEEFLDVPEAPAVSVRTLQRRAKEKREFPDEYNFPIPVQIEPWPRYRLSELKAYYRM